MSRLVNLGTGVSINPDKVDLVSSGKNMRGLFDVHIFQGDRSILGDTFDTADEAMKAVEEWTAKINGPTDANPNSQSVEDRADDTHALLMQTIRSESPEISLVLDRMDHADYGQFLKRTHAVIAKALGGEA